MVSQIEEGVSIILSIAKKTNSKVFICGHSAGAHLTAMLMYTDFKTKYDVSDECISGLFLVSGVYNLLPLVSTTINDCLGLNHDTAKELSPYYREKSCLTLTTKNKMRILITYGEHDSPAFKQQSEDLKNVAKILFFPH
jgi:arylformamidase